VAIVSLVVLSAVAVIASTVIVRASHLFSDVPTTAGYHDAVSWLATRAVTLGCGAGLYCPDDNVTRAQMALFMNRLGKTLSPTLVGVTGSGATLDLDSPAFLCQTGPVTPTYPQRAKVDVWFSLRASGLASARVRPYYSTDGGMNWLEMTVFGAIGRASASATGEWGFAADHDYLNVVAGTAYLFAILVDRDAAGGTADADEWGCKTLVQLTNRNPDGENPETSITGRARGRTPDAPPQRPLRGR
jgi:hypothetical protein